MDTARIKTYAPKARRDFIEDVTRRAAKFGISEKEIAPIEDKGFQQTMESIAYAPVETSTCEVCTCL